MRGSLFSSLPRHAAALAGYLAIALVYTYPVVFRFTTHCIGRVSDTSLWLWNLWHFRYALTVLHTNPLWTELQYWPYGANLLLHSYGMFYGAMAYFLQIGFNLVATYNILMLMNLVLGAYGVFFIAREWGATWGVAFVSGAAYAFSPFSTFTLDGGVGLEFMSLPVLPFFAWTMARVIRSGKLLDAALAGLALTWVWSCNYYYFIFCMLLVPFFFLALKKPLHFRLARRADFPGLKPAAWAVDLLLAADVLWLAYSLRAGQVEFHGKGSVRELLLYVAPYLAFWGLLFCRLALRHALAVSVNKEAFSRRALFPFVAPIGCWALMNLPMIMTVLRILGSGDSASPPSSWRGGGNPTDVAMLLMPNSLHPLWGKWVSWLRNGAPDLPCGYLGWLPAAGVFWLWRNRRPGDGLALWFAGAACGIIITLGPWLKIFGVHTYLPLPFYFLHLLPVFNNIQTGYRFNVFTLFFFSLLFAAFQTQVKSRLPQRLAFWVAPFCFCWLAFEFSHRGLSVYFPEVPGLFQRLGQRPEGAVLPIPVGAIFDCLGPNAHVGGGPWMLWHQQTVHHKPYVGGSLGRVSKQVYRQMHDDPFLQAVVSAQTGGSPPALLKDSAWVMRYLRQMRLRYVVVNTSLTPEPLQAAVRRWPLRLIDKDGPLILYSF